MRQILKIIFVLIGTLIGAGFASGKEIYTFFLSYGVKGIYGLLLSSAITSIVIYKVLALTKKHSIQTYPELIQWISRSIAR